MRTLALIGPGPAWTDGRPVFDQDPVVLGAHLDHMRGLFDDQTLLLGGQIVPGRSGLALFDTTTVAEADARMAADPAVLAGLFTFGLLELMPYFDAFAGTRHGGAS